MALHQIKVNGRRCVYWRSGQPQAKSMVILHGFQGSHEAMVDFGTAFSDYDVFMPDLPAHGESEPLNSIHSVEAYARWLDSFLRELGIKRPIIVGHSYGALIALTYAILGFGYKQLVLITPYPEYKTSIIDGAYKLGRFLPDKLTRRVLSSYLFSRYTGKMFFVGKDRARQKELVKMGQKANGKTPINVIIEIVEDIKSYRADDFIGDIETKTLLLAGDADWLIDRGFLARCENRQQIEVRLVPEAGHLYPIEEPEAAAKVVIDWL